MLHACTLNQLRSNQLRCARMSVLAVLPIILAGSPRSAQAVTVPFTFEVNADASVFGIPSQNNLTLPTTILGSVVFAPFGTAVYSEAGTVTFVMLPSGDFVPSSVMNDFIASFNGGADTITGTNSVTIGPGGPMGAPLSVTLAITGGTGIFNGATGGATGTGLGLPPPNPGDPQMVSFSGSGQITATGLNAIPEPGTIALLGIGVAGLAGVAVIRKRHRS
jgi:hypothetical protein